MFFILFSLLIKVFVMFVTFLLFQSNLLNGLVVLIEHILLVVLFITLYCVL